MLTIIRSPWRWLLLCYHFKKLGGFDILFCMHLARVTLGEWDFYVTGLNASAKDIVETELYYMRRDSIGV